MFYILEQISKGMIILKKRSNKIRIFYFLIAVVCVTILIAALTERRDTLSGESADKADKYDLSTPVPEPTDSYESTHEYNADTSTSKATNNYESSLDSSQNSSYNYSESSEKRETCINCGGSGSVKYYYGSSAYEAALNGQDDYEFGPCPMCDGKGYTYE